MARIAGVKIIKDAKGRPKQALIDLNRYSSFLEDFLDHLDVEASKDEDSIPWDDAVKKLDKIHGIKRKKK